MKKTLVICLFFISLFGFSQKRPVMREIPAGQAIEVRGNKYFINGEQYGTFEVKKYLQDSNYQAYSSFKKGKSKGALGGFFLGLGSALIIGDVVKGISSDVTYPSFFTYSGAAFVAISIPILSGRKAKIENGIKMYNDGLKSTGSLENFNDYSLNIVSNSNGVGLKLTF